jgi:hypothetical protein
MRSLLVVPALPVLFVASGLYWLFAAQLLERRLALGRVHASHS